MSILSRNFNGTDLIAFKPEFYTTEMVISSVNCFLLLLGILSETLVIASILRVRTKTVDTLFVLSLCCADLIFNLYMLPSGLIVVCNGGWSTGALGFFDHNCSTLIFLGAKYLIPW